MANEIEEKKYMNQIFFTPILFLVFNRPENTRIVFNEIKKIKPSKLYIAADGPRQDNENDKINCQEVRRIIDASIDWDCEVKKLYRDENLGCKKAVSSAITWFFENEEKGIILEDDCLPDESFFWFCSKLLEKYKYNEQIMMISGMNYLIDEKINIKESYFFSKYFPIWGWATWKRAWSLYDINMKDWDELKYYKYFKNIYRNERMAIYLKTMFQETYDNKIDTWDVQWVFTCLKNDGLSIIPKYNLISNIGITGTHFNTETNVQNLLVKSLDVNNIIDPNSIIINNKYNKLFYNQILDLQFGKITLKDKLKKIVILLRKIIKIILKKLLFYLNKFMSIFNIEIIIIKKDRKH